MWDERYSAEAYAYGKQPNDFVVEQWGILPKGTVLCLAEGEGRNAVYLAKQGFDVVAVDSSSAGMQKAKKLAAEKNVSIKTIVSDLAEFDFGMEQYDAVVSIFCHLPVQIRARVHQHVIEAIRPGGVLLLEAYRPEQLKFKTGGPPVAELTMRLEDLKNEIRGLEIIYAVEIEREVREGLYHTGKGAVVQLIARKP